MHRIDSANVEADKFGVGKDGFTEGTPGVTAATETTDDWFDGVQEELCNAIEDAGITLVKGTRDQLSTVIHDYAKLRSVNNWFPTYVNSVKNVTHRGLCRSDIYYVSVGDDDGTRAAIYTSRDGFYWEAESPPANAIDLNGVAWNGIAYGTGTELVCAVGDVIGGTDPYILTAQTGGGVWTQRTPTVARAVQLNAVAHDQSGLWVAVGEVVGAANPYILSSTDGITWTERTPTTPRAVALNAVAHNGSGLWVAVGDVVGGTDPYILTSPDGITWTERTPSVAHAYGLNGVAYGGGLWVAVGENDGTDAYILTSPDGITWTARTPSTAEDSPLYAVDYDASTGLWLAAGYQGNLSTTPSGDALMYASLDGTTWRKCQNMHGSRRAIANNGAGERIAVGYDYATSFGHAIRALNYASF